MGGRIVRSYDWRSEGLFTLIRAYDGDQAAEVMARWESSSEGLTREEYEAAVTRLFVSLGQPAPLLPSAGGTVRGWDGACAGNDYRAASRFLGVFAGDATLARHAGRLVAWRTRLVGLCPAQSAQVDALVSEIRSATASDPALREAAGYLAGAAFLYTGRAADAAAEFEALAHAGNGWIREAALYSMARALMVAAQKNWDGYSDFGRIDAATLGRARAAFASYSTAFPRGAYAASAANMARRLAYLGRDGRELNRLIIERFARLHDAKDFAEIRRTAGSEIGNYVDLKALTVETFPFEHPLLAATLRPHARALAADPASSLLALTRAKPRYAAYPGLYELMAVPLLAAAGEPAALTLAPPVDTPLSVMRGILYQRAVALERLKRYAEARAVLHGIARELPDVMTDDSFVADMFRLHLADGDYSDAFAAGSPLTNAEVARDLFERIGSEETLRALAKGTGAGPLAAQRELLFRLLRERRWKDFLVLYRQAGKPAPFTEAETAARTLARAGDDPKGLFNIGSFLHRRNGVGGDCCPCEKLSNPPPRHVDAGVAPIALYGEAITRLRRVRDEALEPEVLHHAILCFQESSDARACQRGMAVEVPKGARAAWFHRLKTKYAQSIWAARTPYYY
jgi:hypothetical protein